MLPPDQRKQVLRELSEKRIGLQEALAALRNGAGLVAPDLPRQAVADDRLIDLACAHLESVFARRLGLGLKIDRNSTFEPLGVDSVKILELVRLLERTFGPLPKTLLFEYNTLARLAAYFAANHRDALTRELGLAGGEVAPAPVSKAANEGPAPRTQNGLEEIAIIGLALRFPGARNADEFWSNLASGRSSIREIPKDRFPGEAGWGGFIEDADKFDPLFFGISPREAEQMDPQERLFLEVAWETLEDAGYSRERLIRSAQNPETDADVGVFVGVMYGAYQLYSAHAAAGQNSPGPSSPYWSIPNRVSYFCNFHGPSLAVDTACSASLTAVHLAAESIRRGECGAALAGGVTLLVHPRQYQTLAAMKMLSRDDKCRAFGKGADGMVAGEGVGAVLLRPLRDALRDGDQIYGVIKGSSINSGGKNGGYTVPDPISQANVVAAAFRRAGVDPKTITCLEAHGTGTALGDPIEARGLAKAFGENSARQFCALGSVKSNIGHLQAAAGIAGIAKVLLQLKHRQLVPTLHTEEANPFIDFHALPFYLPKALEPWNGSVTEPRRAGISSFGIGGANAHIVIEGVQQEPMKSEPAPGPFLIPLSARTEESLRDYALRFRDWLQARKACELDLGDLAFNWQTGRESMACRLAMVARDRDDLLEKLDSYLQNRAAPGLFCSMGLDKSHPILSAVSDLLAVSDISGDLFALGEWDKLAALWTAGFNLDWMRLNAGKVHRRISLPAYPFARRSFWVQSAGRVAPAPEPVAEPARPAPVILRAEPSSGRTEAEIREWLTQRVAAELKMQGYEVDPSKPFNDFGVDSLVGTALAKSLSEWLNLELQSTLLWEYPTIAALSEHLSTRPSRATPPGVTEPAGDEIDAWIDNLAKERNAELQRA